MFYICNVKREKKVLPLGGRLFFYYIMLPIFGYDVVKYQTNMVYVMVNNTFI